MMCAKEANPRSRLIVHSILFWVASIVLGGMVLDGGVLMKYYCVASLLLWPALLWFAWRHGKFSPTESAVFQAAPLLLFVLCFVIASVVHRN